MAKHSGEKHMSNWVASIFLLLASLAAGAQSLQGTAFTYQGRLSQAGVPTNGNVDMVFDLFDAAAGGNAVGPSLAFTSANGNPVSVIAGVFDVTLDFGALAFNGATTDQRYLRITVNGTPLAPLTPIQNAPYALQSRTSELAYTVSNGAIGTAQINASQIQRRVGGTCTVGSSIRAINTDGTVSCQDAGSGTITGVSAGNGLSGGGSSGSVSLSADTSIVQQRVSETCDPGSAIRTIAIDGTVTCQTSSTGTITSVTAGRGMAGGGTSGGVTLDIANPLYLSGTDTNGVIIAENTSSSGSPVGIQSLISADSGAGVYGGSNAISGTGTGVFGSSISNNGFGVIGANTSTGSGAVGVFGQTASTGGMAIYGSSYASSGTSSGVFGQSASPNGRGVYGRAADSLGSGLGNGTGIFGESGNGPGVLGRGQQGVRGETTASNGFGVVGYASAGSGFTRGVYGQSDSPSSRAVEGYSGPGVGVYGSTLSGFAGYFAGNVQVTGTLSKAAGSFQIDHPLDPANRYLFHSFVESPDMKNIYDGVVTLDANGEAWVELPAYFEALNRDFRYQLTALDAPAPSLFIAARIQGNRFKLAGGQAGQQVSWQVTGTRKDAFAEAHRIVPEVDKPAGERGKYLHPTLFGQLDSMSVAPMPESIDLPLAPPVLPALPASPMLQPVPRP